MARITPRVFTDQQGRTVDIRNWQTGDSAVSTVFIRTIAEETHFTNNFPARVFAPLDEIDASRIAALDDLNQVQPVAFESGRMVGQLWCGMLEAEHPYVGHIARFGMMVLREFWGSGLAAALVEAMDDYAVPRGIVRIEAMVRADNARGRAFYRRHGFTEEGTRRMAGKIGGKYIDDIFIAKIYRP